MASPLHWLEMAGVRALVAALGALGMSSARRTGERLGRLVYGTVGVRRRVVRRQIRAAFPGLAPPEVERIARAAYAHFARVTIETALVGRLGPAAVLELFEGEDDTTGIADALRAGSGVVLVTGHVGSWELAGAYVAARGFPFDAIARRMRNPLFDAYITRARERVGMRIVHDSDAVRLTPRALRSGRAVGFISDQGVKGLASTYVPFFGRPAKTPRGAAVFAYRFAVPAFFVAAMLRPSGKYWFHVQEIPVERAGDREEAVDRTVAAYTRILETLVRRHPDQYFWMHRRWRRQPLDTPAELRDPSAGDAA